MSNSRKNLVLSLLIVCMSEDGTTEAFVSPANRISTVIRTQHKNAQLLLYAMNENSGNEQRAFGDMSPQKSSRDIITVRSSLVEEADSSVEEEESTNTEILWKQTDQKGRNPLVDKLIGNFDDSRLAFPEIGTKEVSRNFSNLSYKKNENKVTQAIRNEGSVVGAAALISGCCIGAGILALPTATAPSGFLPSSLALGVAWLYMTISGLLIAELCINRMGQTGRLGVGLLELYKSNLSSTLSIVGIAAYLFLHYAVMTAYVSKGSENLATFLNSVGLNSITSVHGLDQLLFVAALGSLVYFSQQKTVENVNNVLVIGVIASFLTILGIGAGTTDVPALLNPVNQHPELVVDAFPICFLSMVYHNVVPTVVTQLEGDREKITKALIGGTTVPFLMFLAWNGIILGNIINEPGALDSGLDPIAFLQSQGIGGESLGVAVSTFSELAIITSFIGFIYGLLDAFTDAFKLPLQGAEFEKWKPALYAGVLAPPLLFSLGNPDIFFDALDYGGAFGVSTLFLVLPPIMVWKQRYDEENTDTLTVPPMVPFGKVPLASLWKAAGTLILEQGAERIGVFDFFKHLFAEQGWFS